jgi:hypothetical protein
MTPNLFLQPDTWITLDVGARGLAVQIAVQVMVPTGRPFRDPALICGADMSIHVRFRETRSCPQANSGSRPIAYS